VEFLRGQFWGPEELHAWMIFLKLSDLTFICLQMILLCTLLVLVQHALNSDLASLFEWVTSNGFTVNISKWQSMFMARRHHRHQLCSIQLLLNNNVLQLQKSVKYLGVIVDDGLTWSDRSDIYTRRAWLPWLLSTGLVCIYHLTYRLLCTMCLCYPTSLIAVWFGISVPSHYLIIFTVSELCNEIYS